MAIARVTTWSSGNVLTASALNGEFNNILNNALALISPLTGNLDVNGKVLQNIAAGSVTSPGAYFNNDANTGIYSSAADTFDITAGGIRSASFATIASGVNYVDHTPAITTAGPIVAAAGTDTDITLNVNGKGLNGVLFNTNTGTPAANNAYRASVVKGWINFQGTGTVAINGSYNVTSLTDNGTGDYTVTWDRDFGSTAYVIAGVAVSDGGGASTSRVVHISTTGALAAGTSRVKVLTDAGDVSDAAIVTLLAIGAQ